MDYLQEAFGGFNPQIDQAAAIKFALSTIFMEERLKDLSCLLTDGHEIGAVEGEPGWIIERRDTGLSGDMPGYVDWPEKTNFHAHVEPSAFELAHPHIFMGIDEFHGYVRKAIEAYVEKNPSKIDMAKMVISHLRTV